LVKWRLGGPDPLDGISVWRRAAPVPHWHFVTYGLSELYAKESDDPAVSGFGFELTMRVADHRRLDPPAHAAEPVARILARARLQRARQR
ncbi:suppressor of fused domain protein, partial [Burkholderia cenocepacia]|nr:suppressor of fused domain protein [Burkholderia cenocepacia]